MIMREFARKLGADVLQWALVGLLHDLDYDLVKESISVHGLVSARVLEGRLPEDSLHAVRSHDYRTGVKPESQLDKALIAVDCVWVLVARTACAEFEGKVSELAVDPLAKKLDSESFPVYLRNGTMLCKDSGVGLKEFMKLALNALPADLTIIKETREDRQI